MSMNKKYLKIIFSVLAVFGFFAFITPIVLAQSDFGLGTAGRESGLSSNALSKSGDIPSILGYLISIALSLSGIFFFLLILYAGFIWMTAAGSTEKVQSAKSKMISAVIGLVIVLSAYALTSFIFDSLIQVSDSKCEPTCPDTQVCISKNECVWDSIENNKKCCEDKCEIIFGQYGGKCSDVGECQGKILSGYCYGSINTKCCIPLDQYKTYEQEVNKGAVSADINVQAPEKNACEKAGNFCVNESSCLAIHNGTVSGESGCAKGDVCCKDCLRSAGGWCVKEESSCKSSDAIKAGYCFGAYEGYFCCTGEIKD